MAENIFFCPYDGCGKTYKRELSLGFHINWHKNVKVHTCDLCPKAYTRSSYLKRHVATKHTDNKVTSCEFRCERANCGKIFKSSQTLKVHHASHEKRLYKCNSCDKAFFKNVQLRIHEFEHTGVLPFKCPHDGCTKAFQRPALLKTHLKSHMEYKCDEDGCDEVFAKWTLLQCHKASQHRKAYRCGQCDKTFKGRNARNSHATIHKETRDVFLCPHESCPRYYYHEKNLKTHFRACHEGIVHACAFEGCDKKFRHRCNLKEHVKCHENGPKPRKNTKPRKRRSIASKVAGYKGTLQEELTILKSANIPACRPEVTFSTNSETDISLKALSFAMPAVECCT